MFSSIKAHNIKSSTGSHPEKQQFFFSPVKVQPKLEIGSANDPYEQEADAMAERVMYMGTGEIHSSSFFKPAPQSVQRESEDEKKKLRRSCTDCEKEKKLRLKESGASGSFSLSRTEGYLSGINSGGQTISDSVRSFFEPRFGYDFSNVKIHNDSEAFESARGLNSLAYTHGNNIVFGAGQYSPENEKGKRLLAHELTHVIQQSEDSGRSAVAPAIQREESKSNEWFSFNFDMLPPELKLRLGSFMLKTNTGSTELSFTKELMKTYAGYSYGGDLYLGGNAHGVSSRLGFNPSSTQLSLGLGYDKYKFGATANPTTGSFGLGLNYGAPLLPMPGDLSAGVYKGEAGAESMLRNFGPVGNPMDMYNRHSDSIDSIIGAVKSLAPVAKAEPGSFGAGLQFSYNPQTGVLLHAGLQWLF